jgi:hypothetical protein
MKNLYYQNGLAAQNQFSTCRDVINADKDVQHDLFGRSLSTKANSALMRAALDEQVATYKRWIANIQSFTQELVAEDVVKNREHIMAAIMALPDEQRKMFTFDAPKK